MINIFLHVVFVLTVLYYILINNTVYDKSLNKLAKKIYKFFYKKNNHNNDNNDNNNDEPSKENPIFLEFKIILMMFMCLIYGSHQQYGRSGGFTLSNIFSVFVGGIENIIFLIYIIVLLYYIYLELTKLYDKHINHTQDNH